MSMISAIVFDDRRSLAAESKRLRMQVSILAWLFATIAPMGSAATSWTIETSVAARYFVDLQPSTAFSMAFTAEPVRPVLPSPDGSLFAVLSRRGDIASDENVSELYIYETSATANAVRSGTAAVPLRQIVRKCRSVRQASIFPVKWTPNGRGVLWAEEEQSSAEGPTLAIRHYILDVDTGKITCLWIQHGQRDTYLVDAVGDQGLYVDYIDAPRHETRLTPAPVEVLSDVKSYNRILLGLEEEGPRRLGLFVSNGGNAKILATFASENTSFSPNIGRVRVSGRISPSGELAMVQLSSDAGASGANSKASIPIITDPSGRPLLGSQYMIVNLRTGFINTLSEIRPGKMLMRSGLPVTPEVLWSPDGMRVAVTNAHLQTSGADDEAFILVYEPGMKVFQKVCPLRENGLQLVSVTWLRSERLATEWRGVDEATMRDRVVFSRGIDGWERSVTSSALEAEQDLVWVQPRMQEEVQRDEIEGTPGYAAGLPTGRSELTFPPPQPCRCSNGLTIILEESPDIPQRLVASVAGRTETLIGPDPGIAGITIARSLPLEWKTSDGQLHRGRLTLPAQADKALPLVIQIYHHMPNVFRPDGHSPSGQAKQALAARGIAVLEISAFDAWTVNESGAHDFGREVSSSITYIDSAIDAVVGMQLIDLGKLAVCGFSRTGLYARAALLGQGRHRFRAAAANDSFAASLTNYNTLMLSFGRYNPTTFEAIPKMHGGRLFSATARWLAESPELAARYATGALLETDHSSILNAMTRYQMLGGAFLEVGRPLEFVVIVNGGHNLNGPRARFASLAANADWFDFWLNGHERTTAVAAAGETKEMLADKYARWRKMWYEWERQQTWEAAGHPMGSIPDKDFKVPEKNSGTLKEVPEPEPAGANKN